MKFLPINFTQLLLKKPTRPRLFMTHTAERKQSFADLLKTNSHSQSNPLSDEMNKLQIQQAIQNVQNDTDSGVEWEDPMKRQRSKSIVLGMPSIWSDKRRSSTEPTMVRRHSLYPQLNGYQNLLENVEMDIQQLDNIGQGRPLSDLLTEILYLVEFKGGRSDVFYYNVIVEADRGKDLGKIIQNTLTGEHLQKLYASNPEALTDLHKINKQIYPRKVYRQAQPSEVTMLVSKSQDESKALQLCQLKAQERQLPMSVVDCEFQWDRRKLTFYFVADRRIDFRELVRDLFKIYKTRIWMMAVSNTKGFLSEHGTA